MLLRPTAFSTTPVTSRRQSPLPTRKARSIDNKSRGALAQCKSWIHVLAAVTNEQDSVFGNELDMVDQATRQVSAYLRSLDRGPAPGGPQGPRPPMRQNTGPRPGGPPRNPGGPR